MAFAGFRHAHINCLYGLASRHPGIEIVAACEENPKEAGGLLNGINITHNNFEKMLKEVECDSIAVGDYYSKRGPIMIQALKAGKHVLLDKPICVKMSELEEAEKLAKKKKLKIGAMLDLRMQPNFVRARELILAGKLGEITAVSFGGQHPLMLGSRPGWYFEKGKHGGTINDIAIHGIDIVEWMTGLTFTEINAARTWNAFAKGIKHFNDAAQFMLTMDNGCGVMGDVSYFSPDSCSYGLPYYWNMMFWGTKGVIRANIKDATLELACDGDKNISNIAQPSKMPPDYLELFLMDINGKAGDLNTQTVIDISRKTLKIQEAADKKIKGIKLG